MIPASPAAAPEPSEPSSGGGLGRREFIKSAALTGLLVSVQLPRSVLAAPGTTPEPAAAGDFAPNAFVHVSPDNWVTVIVRHHEMGQGTTTGIATLVAEELDADWSRVRAEYAPSIPKVYTNPAWGPAAQGTGGSSAMHAGFEQMRSAGATARAMLVAAAAKAWHVPASEITTHQSVLSHRSGKHASYGEFALAAAKLPVPTKVKLKPAAKFELIGKDAVGRLDSVAKCNGTALYTIDVKLPGLLTAVIARPPAFGARLSSFDASAAKAVRGVTDVVQVPEGVAVVATGMWPALRGRAALKLKWDTSEADKLSSEGLFTQYRELAKQPGAAVKHSPDTQAKLERSAKVIDAVYEFPFLAHAPMEPLNCVAWLHDGGLETWSGHQAQTIDHNMAALAAGLPFERVKLNSLISGGSFGRRANFFSDYVVEAVHVAKAIAGRAPVRVQRTREDDMQAGLYRPQFVHAVRVGLDAQGAIQAWRHTVVGQSIMATAPGLAAKPAVDATSVEGVWPTAYAIDPIDVDLHSTEVPVRPLWWRSVGHTHTAYVMETLIDELAAAAGQDPVQYRLALLDKQPRHAAVLRLVADKAGWGTSWPAGRARGVALHESFGTRVAQVVECSRGSDGLPRAERVVVAVDCGTAINPDVVRAQMEGGIGFALSAALYSEITFEHGRVDQSNFDDYRMLRIQQMPKIEVHIMPSSEPPSGVGEPGVPPLAPALANAWFQLTRERVRRLPFARHAAPPRKA